MTPPLILQELPKVEVAFTLEPEDLALPLLKLLNIQKEWLKIENFLFEQNFVPEYCGKDQYERFYKIIMETWTWLIREVIIAPLPKNTARDGYYFITRRGFHLIKTGTVKKFKILRLFPQGIINPELASKIEPLFVRGDYETAVFQAFKQVEVKVRKAANLDQDVTGVKLITEAFKPENGVLTDDNQTNAEKTALLKLFSGAFGLFRNPTGHREVDFSDPVEVAEIIMIADVLVRIADKHSHN